MPNRRVATQSTVIPFDYDKASGFSQWAIDIRNQVHNPDKPFDAYQIVSEANKVLKYNKPTKP